MKFKLKYQDGATKKICLLLALAQRRKFSKLIWSGKLNIPVKGKIPNFDVVSFSGKKDFEEQVLSICSFVFHIGMPHKWVLYSDGSHTQREKQYLISKFSFLSVKDWNENTSLHTNKFLNSYLEVCDLSKKLHAIIGHPYERQTLYTDSDVVFYNNGYAYFNSEILSENFWYTPDTNWGDLKTRGPNTFDMFALNSGTLILNEKFDFNLIFEYLENLNFNFGYFTEQNSFDYSFKKQNAKVLDPRQFIVNTEDQFDVGMTYSPDQIALRHYVNPVRHKMWQKGWKWHFKF